MTTTSPALTAATVKRRPTEVLLTWTVDGDLPASGTVMLSTTLIGGADGPLHQLGVKFLGTELIATFVFDHGSAAQFNVPVTPQRVGSTWSATFPLADLEVASRGNWKAVLTVGASDIGTLHGVI